MTTSAMNVKIDKLAAALQQSEGLSPDAARQEALKELGIK